MVKGKGKGRSIIQADANSGIEERIKRSSEKAELMARSVELQGQGTVKGSRRSKESQWSEIRQAQKSRIDLGLTIRQKKHSMAKSVEDWTGFY